jgi:CheY-specific phosphatase CheX
MQNIFKEAVKNYIDSIEATLAECKVTPHKGYIAEISISGDKNYDIYVIIPQRKLEYISELWFGDKNDYDTKDLVKEIANLIVGNAKVIAENKGINFTISTPKFLGEYKNIDYDDILKFKFKNRCFYILFKGK